MSKGLLGTGVTAWVESDTAVRHAAPLKDGSGYGQIVIGEGTGVVCLFLDDPAACYRLAGVAVTLAKSLERQARGETLTPADAVTSRERPSEEVMRKMAEAGELDRPVA